MKVVWGLITIKSSIVKLVVQSIILHSAFYHVSRDLESRFERGIVRWVVAGCSHDSVMS